MSATRTATTGHPPAVVGDDAAVPESIKKLKALKENIGKELEAERKLRQEAESKEAIIPLSLVGPDGQPFGGMMSHAGRNGKGLSSPPGSSAAGFAGSKGGRNGAVSPKGAPTAVKEKLAALKLDKNTQRDIEAELERRSTETVALKAQNNRLRDIIALRQQCCARREAELAAEIQRLENMCDTLCVDANDMDGTMARLREMNHEIQEGASKLKAVIEDQAEADRLQLIRNYRVKMREVRQQVVDQDKKNLEGASVWIQRHEVLVADVENAEKGLDSLKGTIEQLRSHNQELELMQAHQRQQRDQLTNRVAVVKRENKQLEKHVSELESEVIAFMQRQQAVGASSHSPARSAEDGGQSPTTRHTNSRLGTPSNTFKTQLPYVGRPGAHDTADRKQEQALSQLRKALEEMRKSLKQVRAAHVELLQERTELQIFLRQCIEDVRREMFRHTVVSNMGQSKGDTAVRLLADYGPAERKKLMDILQSKLRVYSTLYASMFPQKPLSLEELQNMDDAALAAANGGTSSPTLAGGGGALRGGALRAEEERLLTEALNATSEGRSNAVVGPDGKLQAVVSSSAALNIEELWGKWKQWTTTAS